VSRRIFPGINEWLGIRTVVLAAAAGLFYGAAVEFHAMAWGTGNWIGEFSAKWAGALAAFVALSVLSVLALAGALWGIGGTRALIRWRQRLEPLRWTLVPLLLAAPVLLLQYSPWGAAVRGPYLRLLIWIVCAGLTGALLTRSTDRLWRPVGVLAGVLLGGAALATAAAFAGVTAYPFSLGWSEGNRLWDYSLLFGSDLYRYDPRQQPAAYLDFGRQLLGGLPFLLPRVSIEGERLWLALLSVAPFAVLGMLVLRSQGPPPLATLVLGGAWSLIFLGQGPIHAPLVVCAIMVAIAWGRRTWLAAILVFAAGYFAEVSRFTWMFAPAMWIVMLEIGAADLIDGRIPTSTWRRATLLSLAGLAGSAAAYAGLLAPADTSQGSVASVSTSQALLWYRLLPNATYGDGIVLGLLKAAGPLLLLLIYLGVRQWKGTRWQQLAIALPLVAFLIVGLIVSTKIGGGGDLHNMDMFLIGLLFTAAVFWKALGRRWAEVLRGANSWIHGALVLLVALPALGPLMALRPLSFAADADWLSVLADVERPRDLGSLPSPEAAADSLGQLVASVDEAKERGEVLFMDQRQLLTFGDVDRIPLVSEYEKKRMMDEALSGNEAYFKPFYRDLALKRFALIISSPLRTPIKDRDYGFGEENNAWVEWIARPVLCYYRELDTLDDVKVELLVPREGPGDCSSVAPPPQQ
jgi:hypothetical protein